MYPLKYSYEKLSEFFQRPFFENFEKILKQLSNINLLMHLLLLYLSENISKSDVNALSFILIFFKKILFYYLFLYFLKGSLMAIEQKSHY